MDRPSLRFQGVELYFDELEEAKSFYQGVLGLELGDEEAGRYARFGAEDAFICLERKGTESYPSREKAVLFFRVPDLLAAIDAIGRERIVASELEQGKRRWAVLHDPEQHNVLLFEAGPH